MRSLAELLDEIELTFKSLTRPTQSISSTNPDLRAGLKKLGPYVPAYKLSELPAEAKIAPPVRFPSLMFVAVNEGGFSDKDEQRMFPDFVYANRTSGLPWECEPLSGTAYYECGAAFRVEKRLFWIGFHVSIAQDGAVTAAKELRQERVKVVRRGEYTRKRWDISYFAAGLMDVEQEAKNQVCAAWFAWLFGFWAERERLWSVSVRRDGRRVTFCVPPQNTKHYFRDRERDAIASDGKRKRIIHYVHAHDRLLPDGKTAAVREHIRGERHFYWKGYECAVTAPAFHTFSAQAFDIAAHHKDELMGQDLKDFIPMSQAGALIANLEDRQRVH